MERILDAASSLVLSDGVEGLSTRLIAERAQIPVASLYQYFADKEGVLLALVDRDMVEMDQQLLADLAQIQDLTLVSMVETALRSFTKVYSRRPAFVEIWLRGRTNPAIRARGRAHNEEIATMVHQFAESSGVVGGVPPKVARLAVEVGDRIFETAYAEDIEGDQEFIEHGIAMITRFLDPYVRPDATADPGTPQATPHA